SGNKCNTNSIIRTSAHLLILSACGVTNRSRCREKITMEKENNTYVIDTESGTEMARLIDHDRILTAAMGGLLPPDFEPAPGKTVLDLACGPGGWAQEVAFAYPEMQVLGIDISRKMLGYAQSLTQAKYLDNLQFEIMDVRRLPLPFPDSSFNLITTRAI